MNENKKIIIIGGGPTGLGAAYRLNELNQMYKLGLPGVSCEWLLIEKDATPGGLSQSFVDENGFTWDIGGHVLFSHYEYFTKVLDYVCPDDGWNILAREAWVWIRDRFIPYPFQNNIWRLPKDDLINCLNGLAEIQNRHYDHPPANFYEWLKRGFGEGLMNIFMEPYNFKVWAYHPKQMNVEWMGERVATVDMKRVIENVVRQQDSLGWGPNNIFRFPKHGGTGSIYKHLYAKLPREKCQLESEVVMIDARNKQITLNNGNVLSYDSLITTIPLNQLCRIVKNLDDISDENFAKNADKFVFSSTNVIGIGVEGQTPDHLKTKCWNYFPENNCPFYRVTVFSNYSKYHVAKPNEQWSLLCEVSESKEKPVNLDSIIDDTIQGLLNVNFLTSQDKIVSKFHKRLEYGYPTPFVGRDQLCDSIHKILEHHNIYSRGRFGAWKYEVGNQDHSVMQGVECVDHIFFQSEEMTVKFPSIVNKSKEQKSKIALCMMKNV